mmetsp:Transcript_107940/g.311884  ORF Transcript_107940/g.311884 Transcript_107940/m.311884 type:complete len:1188 (+) Transcript_107940:47-3610(+)
MAPVDDPTSRVDGSPDTSDTACIAAEDPVVQRLRGGTGMKLGTLAQGTLEEARNNRELTVLDLKDNKIASLPADVFSGFGHIKVLDLRKNALEELPGAISAMQSLEDLMLDQNRLREIPNEVCMLPNLRSMSVGQNALKCLPDKIGNMTQLRSLSLGDNQIAEIPPEIGDCKQLQMLYLHHNHFNKLPTTMGRLENLSEIALEWFRYTTPPLPRVIKGEGWKKFIVKLVTLCKEKTERGERFLSCIEVLSEFSQKSFDANAIDSKRRTRLHVACLEGHVGVAMALAESGSKCDSLDCEGYSPLLVAVREEHPDIATALVRAGVDVNRGGGLFGSPLHVATVNFDPHMVLLLINGKADVNQTDADGNTPLHVLMSVFDKGGKRAGNIGRILLRNGADCNVMNSDKWAPLHLAARRGQLRGICFVLSQIDAVEPACLKGTCSHHQATVKKSKSNRVRTCPRVFDLNLRGGSHLWTPLHLAGHACHVPVVQVLIESGADVFLRNVDSRTARHVSRGNLAISKLLRKAEDEWLWYRIHHGNGSAPEPPQQPETIAERSEEDLLDGFSRHGVEDEDEDPIEAIANDIDGSAAKKVEQAGGSGGASSSAPRPVPRGGAGHKAHRIVDKCRDTHYNKQELQSMQAMSFAVPSATLEEFSDQLLKVANQGSAHLLPLLMAKQWAKEKLPKLLEDEARREVLLEPSLVGNEDFARMLLVCLPREQLHIFGKLRNEGRETMLHILCRSGSGRAYPSSGSRADILALLLCTCPAETFDLEAQDIRGQTPLHLAVQSGDLGLVQVLLDGGANPNAQEETTGWTPLHFAVAKAHYTLILQLLQHDATNVNQVDKFDWPPLLEACSRLDARAVSLLVNGGANLGFRNQHQFDVLKAVDTSKKDLAAKRWMSCLVVSNGFRFEESRVQLNLEDRQTLERERTYFVSRAVPAANPPFFVPDHLAPRCHSCKVLFALSVRRYHCRSCGIVLCSNCFKWRATSIVFLDERLRSRQMVAQSPASLAGLEDAELAASFPGEVRTAGFGERVPPGPKWKPSVQPSRASGPSEAAASSAQMPAIPAVASVASASGGGSDEAAAASPRSDDSEEPPLAEELPAMGPPSSIVCPASEGAVDQALSRTPSTKLTPGARLLQGGFTRERGVQGAPAAGSISKMVRLCASCTPFFEAGLGETYSMLQRRGVFMT